MGLAGSHQPGQAQGPPPLQQQQQQQQQQMAAAPRPGQSSLQEVCQLQYSLHERYLELQQRYQQLPQLAQLAPHDLATLKSVPAIQGVLASGEPVLWSAEFGVYLMRQPFKSEAERGMLGGPSLSFRYFRVAQQVRRGATRST
jgi:hypothetical protein